MGLERSLYGDVGLPLGMFGPGEAWFDLEGNGPLAANEEEGSQPLSLGRL